MQTKSASTHHRITHPPARSADAYRADIGSAESQREHEVALVRDGLLSLGESERIVLSLYYAEELTIPDIALVLNITPSHAAQLRTDGLASLEASLARRAA